MVGMQHSRSQGVPGSCSAPTGQYASEFARPMCAQASPPSCPVPVLLRTCIASERPELEGPEEPQGPKEPEEPEEPEDPEEPGPWRIIIFYLLHRESNTTLRTCQFRLRIALHRIWRPASLCCLRAGEEAGPSLTYAELSDKSLAAARGLRGVWERGWGLCESCLKAVNHSGATVLQTVACSIACYSRSLQKKRCP